MTKLSSNIDAAPIKRESGVAKRKAKNIKIKRSTLVHQYHSDLEHKKAEALIETQDHLTHVIDKKTK